MNRSRSIATLLIIILVLAGLVQISGRGLLASTRLGLEFRGGYEVYYLVEPLDHKGTVASADLLKTADQLRHRADSIGMSEPDIRIEGTNHIRLKVAGLTSADQVRSILGEPVGLPTRITEKYTQTVGSVLGASALRDTLTAGLIGMGLIVLLLLALYRVTGLLAAFCLVIYLWLMLSIFNALHATLSLSAIVAFVLGVGMAADASIIALSRICEELRNGRDEANAIRVGFSASVRTIRDANLVTAIAMAALFLAGIGPIQGFALTMVVSLIVSVLTNFLLLRLLIVTLSDARLLPLSLLIRGVRSTPAKPRVVPNFVRFGWVMAVASTLAIAVGGWYYSQHGLNLDIDFTAGTALDVDLREGITQEAAEKLMTDAGTVPATVAIGGTGNQHIAARFDEVLTSAELDPIIAAFRAKYGQDVVYEENTADPSIARDFAFRAVYAVIFALVGIAVYIVCVFSWAVAVATLVSILHDLLLVCAIFAFFKLEIDVSFIAALLTIMGYSLNDKIVIFGRVRDNLLLPEKPVEEETTRQAAKRLANLSIRQTLGRSTSTVLTVVLASAALYWFGCEPLQMFALAILLGLISGAVSSIFLACPIWAMLRTQRGLTSLAPVRL